MTRRLLVNGLFAALLAAPTTGGAAPPRSDVERLREGLPAGFQRPLVVIYPLVDQRLLVDAKPGSAAAEVTAPSWEAFLDGLRGARNLALQMPARTRRAITEDAAYRRALELALATANRGYQDYREVRLEAAADGLGHAVEAFIKLEHHVVRPREVARAALTQGLALLESDDPAGAERAFRTALLIDPGLRLRPGYDHPHAIEAFESARHRLIGAPDAPPAPPDFAVRSPRPPVKAGAYVLRGRILRDRLEITIRSPLGVSVESQPTTDDPASDGSRLASRVIACLPFGRQPPAERHRARLHLDAGFDAFIFTEAPVETFAHGGVGVHLSWLAAPNFALDLHGALTNSGRDRQEHLRNDVATVRLRTGPGFEWGDDRFRAFAHIMVEVATMSEVRITTNPACQFFSPQDPVPPLLCDFDHDIRTVGRSWTVGPALVLGGSVRLADQIYLAARLNGATYLFETVDNGLGRPVGASLSLGYRLF